ncbi:MAG: hypothetical protein RLZZ558_1213 [Planctomycetota bacterium]|jgi:glycine/D-amino acid oxidase-like deaminating enzyme
MPGGLFLPHVAFLFAPGGDAVTSSVRVDALVIGGGVAGLFTLDALARSGRHALLVESEALGNGQTTSSQGILHAGVKYALGGVAGDDAVEAAAAADRWRGMLGGAAVPDLTTVRTLTEHEFLWRTAGFMGAAGMLGARLALRTRPETVAPPERPTWLAGVKGDVLRLAETVIDPRDLLCRLAGLHADRLALGQVRSLTRTDEAWHVEIVLGDAGCLVEARHVILSAGAGNACLLQQAGLVATEPMQRRPLRQAMVRGPLPWVFGHCIDGARTRVTITSDETPQGVVWHVGGELAERGVAMRPDAFLRHAHDELQACLPGADLSRVEWSSYAVDRAEPATPNGRRPPSAHVREHHGLITIWPVKLVMAPLAAERASHLAGPASGARDGWPAWTPRPGLAARPWETATWERLG